MFVIRNLSVLAYAQGFTLWHYKMPTASVLTAKAPGYFNEGSDMLATGDMIMVSGNDGGSVSFVFVDGKTVNLAPLT